jgi:hypothetical protein
VLSDVHRYPTPVTDSRAAARAFSGVSGTTGAAMTLAGMGAPRAPRAPRPAGGAAGGGPPAASGAAAPPPRFPRVPLPATPPAPRPVVGCRRDQIPRVHKGTASGIRGPGEHVDSNLGRAAIEICRLCSKTQDRWSRSLRKSETREGNGDSEGSLNCVPGKHGASITLVAQPPSIIPCVSPKDIRTEPDNRNMLGPTRIR